MTIYIGGMDNTPKPTNPIPITQENLTVEVELFDYALRCDNKILKTWHYMILSSPEKE